jgi:hypothetical protein
LLRPLLAALLLALLFHETATADLAPHPTPRSRDEVAAACAPLGGRGEYWGLDRDTGAYGCRNLDNGNAIDCSEKGLCTDYVGDPRWKRIHDLLQASQPPRARQAL